MADEIISTASDTEPQARYCTPTNAGNQLFAKLVAEKSGLEFTKVLVGKGKPDASADPAELVGLCDFVTYGSMTEPIQSGEQVDFTVEYRNDMNNGLKEGFWMSEFGVWARMAGETTGDVMVYYGCLGDYPQYVEAYDGTHIDSRRFPLSIKVGNAKSVSVDFSTKAFVTSEEMAGFVTSEVGKYADGSQTFDCIALRDRATLKPVWVFAENGVLYYNKEAAPPPIETEVEETDVASDTEVNAMLADVFDH